MSKNKEIYSAKYEFFKDLHLAALGIIIALIVAYSNSNGDWKGVFNFGMWLFIIIWIGLVLISMCFFRKYMQEIRK